MAHVSSDPDGPRPIQTQSPTLQTLFAAMDAEGVTSREMAATLGVHPNSLGAWRAGRSEPGLLTVEAMAAALGFRLSVTAPPAE